ncbi:MAG: hypothetical protein IKA72_00505 [Clostridia bacterium]|nr:hypothetical protein [Clostridia bacterium]
MKTKYYLNQDILPTIPTPHDCIITSIEREPEFLILRFEEDLSYHDSIKDINPNAKSLTMKIHLLFADELEVYKWKKHLFFGMEGFTLMAYNKVFSRIKGTAYLSHYIAYNCIIIELFQSERIVLKLESDYIELEWIEK